VIKQFGGGGAGESAAIGITEDWFRQVLNLEE